MTGRPPLPPHLTVMLGAQGSGKSEFVRWAGYLPHQVISTDEIRLRLTDDPGEQEVNFQVTALVDIYLRFRLRYARPTAVDATHRGQNHRAAALAIAKSYGIPAVAVVMRTDPALCVSRQAVRRRTVPATALDTATVLQAHHDIEAVATAGHGLRLLEEGFAAVLHVNGNHPDRETVLIGDRPSELDALPWIREAYRVSSLATLDELPLWLLETGQPAGER